jgi:CubicO group peptidase (beta-lactamase class C family)
VRRGEVPGAIALLSRGGETHVEKAGDVWPDTIFRISSMSKPVTAAAALILVEECVLRLDDPVDEYLPELASRRVLTRLDAPLGDTVPAARPITVRDLLMFTLGLGFGQGMWGPPGSVPIMDALSALGQGMPAPAGVPGPDEWLRRLGELPLVYQPGERWLYNTGSCILSVLLARVSGQSLPELLRKRLFEPLGMKDTAFFAAPSQLDRLVNAYRLEAGRLQLDGPATSAWKTPPAFPDGAAGLVSTVDDYLAFSRLLLAGGRVGNHRLLSEGALNAMLRDHLTERQRADGAEILGAGRGWGYGLSVVTDDGAAGLPAKSCGWNGGLGSSWVADPRSGLHAILLTQTLFTSPTPPAVHQDFWHVVFSPTYL